MTRVLITLLRRAVRRAGAALPAMATATAALILAGNAAQGAIYVRIPDVPGEVTTAGYDDGTWFEARSGSYGAERDLVAVGLNGTAPLNIGVG